MRDCDNQIEVTTYKVIITTSPSCQGLKSASVLKSLVLCDEEVL